MCSDFKLQKGVSMIETLIIFPIVLMIALWIIHIGLVYQARANLEYAALMGARVGSVSSIDIDRMQAEIARRLAASQVGSTPVNPGDIVITVLNPTRPMFSDCGVPPSDASVDSGAGLANCEIPNFGLQFRSTSAACGVVGSNPGVNIQDANLLRIQVSYQFDSKIPFMNMPLFPRDASDTDGSVGTEVTAVATVRMQTPARITTANESAIP